MVCSMDDTLLYFNNAATSWPKPRQVVEEVMTSLQSPYHEHGRATSPSLKDYPKITREALCEFYHAEHPNHIQFTANATDSLNLLIHGYVKQVNKKIHAITTELEHNSVLRPLKTLEREGAITLSVVPFNERGYVALEDIKEAIQPDTSLAVINHGSNVLGTLQDINKMGEYFAANNIFTIIDTAQTSGHVSIDVSKLSSDALVFTGHKALFGFPGIGGFYLRDPEKVSSFKQGGTGVFSEYPYHPKEMPLKYECGTHNYPGIVSLYAGVNFLNDIGLHSINETTQAMTSFLLEKLRGEDNLTVYSPRPDLPVIPFNIHGMDSDDVAFILITQNNIMTRAGLHCAPLVHKKIDEGRGCVRLSLSYFNTMEECEQVAEAIQTIARSVQRDEYVTLRCVQ